MNSGTSDSILSYSIYSAGLAIGSLSPQEWLVLLSLVAVLLRIITDARKVLILVRETCAKFKGKEEDKE